MKKIYPFMIVAVLLLQNIAAALQLNGTINDDKGKPLADATVQIWTADMKVGASVNCPSCHADCAKSTKTDSAGRFSIPEVDSQLIFRVLVVSDGFVPQLVKEVNPEKGDISVSLKSPPKNIDAAMVLKGKVVDRKGEAVAGATVSPIGAKDGAKRWWGNVEEVADSLAVTNEKGEYVLVCRKPNLQLDLQVEARAFATINFALRSTGPAPVVLEIGEGATISGHLLDRMGKPIAGATIGLVQEDTRPEVFIGRHEVATDADGQFGFYNVGPSGDYVISAALSNKPQQIKVGGDGFNSSSTVLIAASTQLNR